MIDRGVVYDCLSTPCTSGMLPIRGLFPFLIDIVDLASVIGSNVRVETHFLLAGLRGASSKRIAVVYRLGKLAGSLQGFRPLMTKA